MTDHHPDCAWERAACEYKATHHYCPHPEHACTCPPAPKAGPMTDLTLPALREAAAALSGRERAEHVLAFREAHAPNNPRFHHRAMLVDNGGRGSDQQAVTFDADDLSALMVDLREVEAKNDLLREANFALVADLSALQRETLKDGKRLTDARAENTALRVALEAETARAEYVRGLRDYLERELAEARREP